MTTHQQTGRSVVPAEIVALLPDLQDPTVVTMGSFDGVHHGHRALLAHARELATRRGRDVVAVTFSPRPEQVFAGPDALPDICSLAERVARLEDAGARRVLVLPFSRELAGVDAADFASLLTDRLCMETLCVGEDFALGRGRAGTPEELRRLGLDVELFAVRPSAVRRGKASSSHVRQLIAAGMHAELALRSA